MSGTRRALIVANDTYDHASFGQLRAPAADAEALADGATTPEDAQEFGGVITRHASKMERLVADLLRLARLDAQQETLSLSECDIARIFSDVLQGLAPLIESKRHHMTTHVAPGAGSVRADAEKLHDLLRNLVDNAVTYAPAGAEIRLEAWPADGGIQIQPGPHNDAVFVHGSTVAGPVIAHFRSEAARLGPADAAASDRLLLRGRIVQASYPGGFYRYAVAVGQNQFMVDDPRRLPVGENVGIGLPVSSLHIFSRREA